ncbi:hypothetical protein [Kineothrix sp. MB12-C1]|uniref:hypothetical protein n=1 Tax=Kineothrix sp. MB12-C1 TaxID=3070215 RepID=UPI0027D3456B|nr:hypothetical protein [Kineothrix sp. MB12-C1]WMC92042.1 hypothetical protein RBB56_14420 [Kineothrix sp. MB12-C1]
MKKNNLFTGIAYMSIGALFAIAAGFSGTKFQSLLWGFAGGGFGGGALLLWKYFYWTHPNNKSRYKEHLENISIELHDERKEKFRNQSGRYAYILGLITVCISIMIFSVLDSLGMVQHTRVLILYLGGYVIFQYIAGILIFKYLNKKY